MTEPLLNAHCGLSLAAGKSTDYGKVFWVYPQRIYFRHLEPDPRLQFRPLGFILPSWLLLNRLY